jgi:hypothetical protein
MLIGYRVSGIGYRVSGIGYRVSGIGYRKIAFCMYKFLKALKKDYFNHKK